MAMTAWAAKLVTSCDLLVGEGTNFLTVQGEGTDQLVLLQHWDSQKRPYTPKFDGCNDCRMRVQCRPALLQDRRREPLLCVATMRPTRRFPDWDEAVNACAASAKAGGVLCVATRCKASPSQR